MLNGQGQGLTIGMLFRAEALCKHAWYRALSPSERALVGLTAKHIKHYHEDVINITIGKRRIIAWINHLKG